MDDDDVWGSSDGDGGGGDKAELDREWRARRDVHWNSGYREGVEEGKALTVQEGFDTGR